MLKRRTISWNPSLLILNSKFWSILPKVIFQNFINRWFHSEKCVPLLFSGDASGNRLAEKYGLDIGKICGFFINRMKYLNRKIDQPNHESTIEITANEMVEALFTAFPNMERDVLLPYFEAKKIDPLELLELRKSFHLKLRTKVLQKRSGYR